MLSLKKVNFVFFSIISLFAVIFSSCKSDIKVSVKNGTCSVKYSTVLGEALLNTVSALSGEEGEILFDTAEFEKVFSESGLQNVSAVSEKVDSIALSGNTSPEKKDFISVSKIVETSADGKKIQVVFSKERLNALYVALPTMMQSYIDMFMAPVFSDEKMSDAEYIELLASVYGEVVANEVRDSVLNFEIENSVGKKLDFSLKLLEIINIEKELRFEI